MPDYFRESDRDIDREKPPKKQLPLRGSCLTTISLPYLHRRAEQKCPKMSQNVLKMSPKCPKYVPKCPKNVPKCPEMSQKCPKMLKNVPKMVKACPQNVLKDSPLKMTGTTGK